MSIKNVQEEKKTVKAKKTFFGFTKFHEVKFW